MSAAAPSAIGAVLAGGLGSRLGGAKAAIPFAGRPLITYPLATFAAAGIEAVVVAKEATGLPPLSVPWIDEPAEPRHPLCGIVAALEYAASRGTDAAVVLACDMPFVPPALVSWLAELSEPLAVPVSGGHPQPLAARYATALLPALRETLQTGPGPLIATIQGLEPCLLGEHELARFGDPGRTLFNVNTAADLARAEGLVSPPKAP